MRSIIPLRSLLFAPGNQPELVAKLPRSGPDAVVLDLEDAVAPAAKAAARSSVATSSADLAQAHPDLQVWVRVNPVHTEWFSDDVAEALHSALTGVVVPKVESLDDVIAVRRALDANDLGELHLLVGLETARGVANALDILAGPVSVCYFGAEDYVADIGGVRREDGQEVLYARSQVVLGARLGGVHALDQVVVSFNDDAAFVEDAFMGRSLGYGGKLCIHPNQVALSHSVFTPTDQEVERAKRVLAAFEEASRQGIAAIAVDGQMVDEPLAKHARSIIAAYDAN